MATAAKTYEYSVRDRSGKLVKGKLEATSQEALIGRLRGMGYAPLTVAETGTGLNREINLTIGSAVKLKDLAIMSRQFATMINSGLSLIRSLSILAEQTENDELARVLRDLRDWSGLRQADVAAATDRSVAAVRSWEAGRAVPGRAARDMLTSLYRLPAGALDAAAPRRPASHG